jgi:hypothetical protein
MTLSVNRVVDHRDQTDASAITPYHAAFMSSFYFLSPNDRYAASAYYTDPTLCVADLHTLTVVQNLNVGDIDILGNPLWVAGTNKIIFVDDNGSIWATGQDTSGDIYELPLGEIGTSPQLRFTLSGTDDPSLWAFGQNFTLSDGTQRVVLIAATTESGFHPEDYHIWDGSTYSNESLTFVPNGAFQDANSDIWIYGVPNVLGAAISTCYLKRVTDVTGASPYTADQTFTGLPAYSYAPAVYNPGGLIGTFVDGSFVGGWFQSVRRDNSLGYPPLQCDYLIKLDLTAGTVTAQDISATAPSGCKWGLSVGFIPTNSTFFALRALPQPDPSAWILTGTDPDRKYGFFSTSTLSLTASYDLTDWHAGDDTYTETYGSSVSISHDAAGAEYLYTRQAFIGQSYGSGFFQPDNPDEPIQNVGKLWLYEMETPPDGSGDGVVDGSLTLRSWAFSLDGHDFYVLRLGPNYSLVYDMQTGMWSDWTTPGRTNWRAHIGQNWVGANDFGIANTDIVAGDDATGTLWRLDTSIGRDDRSTTGDDKISHIVMGGIQVTGRDSVPCNAVAIDLALGSPTQTGASITLEISDDLGQTWVNCGSNTVVASDYSATVEWRALGQMRAPGRLFRFTDDGATVRFGGANMR